MRVTRPAIVLAAVAALSLAGSASAASGPNTLTFADDAGDAAVSDAYDITGVTYTTTGTTTTTKSKGKQTTAYTPKALVVSMTLAEPPSAVPGALYEIDAETAACGTLYLYFTPDGSGSGGLVGCGEADATGSDTTALDVEPTVAGKVVTWTLPLKSLPAQMKVGSSISEIRAYSTQVDPVTGVVGPYLLTEELNYDNAATDATYKIG